MRAWWPVRVSVAAADCVRGMVVTSGSVAYATLPMGMNGASTLRAVRLVGRTEQGLIRRKLSKHSSRL